MNWKKSLIIVLLFFMACPSSLLNFNIAKAATAGDPAPPKSGKIELVNKRTAYTSTYLKSDGSRETEIYQTPVHYQANTTSGTEWENIDTNLSETDKVMGFLGNGKAYKNNQNSFSLNLSKDLSRGGISLKNSNTTVSLKLSTSNSSALSAIQPQVSNNKALYQNVSPGVDIVYYSMAQGLKEDINLNQYSGQSEFKFNLYLDNGRIEQEKDGSYKIIDPSGNLLFTIPQFYMWDSNGGTDSAENAFSYNVNSDIKPISGGYEFTIKADPDWLASPDRVYPVTIDPSVIAQTGNDNDDSFIESASPNTPTWNQRALYVGNSGSIHGITRALLPFGLPDLSNARILGGTLSVWQYNCHGESLNSGVNVYMTTGYTPKSVTWNSQPTLIGTGDSGQNSHSSFDVNDQQNWLNINVANVVQSWYSGNPTGSMLGSIELTQINEQNPGYRTFAAQNHPDYGVNRPRLTIEYSEYNANYSPNSLPGSVTAATTINLPVTITNTGLNTWTPNNFNLGYHLTNSAGQTLIYSSERTSLPRNIGPNGDKVTLNATIKVPPESGQYYLDWDMVQEGVTWFSSQGVTMSRQILNVVPPSTSSVIKTGLENYTATAGPIDLTTGALSYSATDLAVPSAISNISMDRTYYSGNSEPSYSANQNGYIKDWIYNGLYFNNDTATRLSKNYISDEANTRPSLGTTSAGNLWYNASGGDADYVDLNTVIRNIGAGEPGYVDNSVIYAFTYVFSPTNQAATLLLGSDDGIKVWLNNQSILTDDIYRGFSADSDTVKVQLNQGINTLLIKVSQGSGGYKFSAKFSDLSGMPLSNLTYDLKDRAIYNKTGVLGKGWTASFEEFINTANPDNVYYHSASGTTDSFMKNSDSTYARPAGSTLSLINNNDGTYKIVNKYGLEAYFNQQGKIAYKKDLSGNILQYQYNNQNQLILLSITANRKIAFSYNADGTLATAQFQNKKVSYYYTNGYLTKIIDPAGFTIEYTYDANGKLNTCKDKNGNISSVNYDNGKVTSVVDPLNNITKLNYGDHQATVTDALGRNSVVSFNDIGLMTSFTNAKNYRELYLYDGSYNLTTITPDIPENDQLYFNWSNAYDGNNNLLTSTDPLGKVAKYTYSENNDLLTSTDQDGNVTSNTYSIDGRQLLTKSTDAKGNSTKFEYNSAGLKTADIDALGNKTAYTYSPDGDLLTSISPKNEVTKYEYNARGEKISDTSPLGQKTLYSYSIGGLLFAVSDPSGVSTSYGYDKNGNKTRETNPKGNSKYYLYDKLDRLYRTVDETGAMVTFYFDAVGNKISMYDANGKKTAYNYDELNQLISQTNPSGKTTYAKYDKLGNLTSFTDTNNQTTNISTNKAGEVTSQSNSETSTDINYTATGAISTVNTHDKQTGDTDTAKITYDANGNPQTISSTNLGNTTNTYNADNSQASSTSDNTALNIGYDANGAVSTMATTLTSQNKSLGTNTFSTDADGKIKTITRANNDQMIYTYDSLGRVDAFENRNKNGYQILRFSYRYDSASNVTISANSRGKVIYYDYDARNELIKDDLASYTYDKMGNRTSMIKGTGTALYFYDVSDANRLIKVVYADLRTVNYQYDNNGNVTKQIDSKAGTTTYSYSADNYFTKAVLPDSSSVEYVYDPISKLRTERIETSVSGQKKITKFLYDADRLITETDENGVIQKAYTWDQDENLISVTMPDGKGVQKTYYYLKNAKGDVMGLSDDTGASVVDYDYDSWGNIITSKTTKSWVPQNLDKQNNRLYSGYWYDSTLGLYFMKTRMYDSEIGRFLSADSVISGTDPLSVNPYIYCGNNPITRIDPSGKNWFSNALKYAGKVIVAAAKTIASAVVKASTAIARTVTSAAKTVYRNRDAILDTCAVVAGVALLAVGVGEVVAAAAGAYEAVTAAGFGITALTVGSIDVNEEGPAVEEEMSSYQRGLQGSNATPGIQNTSPIKINNNTRIPDRLGENIIEEVKNVKYLSDSPQLRDYRDAAQGMGTNLKLWVDNGTVVSGPLQQLNNSGIINIIRIQMR